MDQFETDPDLEDLGSYGGPTETMRPEVTSPAIDAGGSSGHPTYDQRGLDRNVGDATDVGAVECQGDGTGQNCDLSSIPPPGNRQWPVQTTAIAAPTFVPANQVQATTKSRPTTRVSYAEVSHAIENAFDVLDGAESNRVLPRLTRTDIPPPWSDLLPWELGVEMNR
jgi:hypothetical protein